MIDISKGRYWDKPWSLIDGCTPCSPGCEHCWAAGMAHRFLHPMGGTTNVGGQFTGRIKTHPERLYLPWEKHRKPKTWAIWNDLAHESVPVEFIDQAFAIMGCLEEPDMSDHTFLFLTKRPKQMLQYAEYRGGTSMSWPPNVWSGLTICNQQGADKKIPIFLQVPGKKFLSIEPMLGPIKFTWHLGGAICSCARSFKKLGMPSMEPDFSNHPNCPECGAPRHISRVDAVILGGETGPGARPMHPDWVRSVRDQCAAAGVPFFFKGWGEWSPEKPLKYCKLSGKRWSHESVSWARDGSEYNPLNPPPDHFPSVTVYRVGRRAAGRLLKGRTHDDLPWRAAP